MKLYKKSQTGKIQVWSAKIKGNVIYVRWGLLKGKKQTQTHIVETNQSGRSLEEQIALNLKSLIEKRKDKGYVTELDQVKEISTNQSNIMLPMNASLAKHPYSRIIERNMMFQPKLNGHRCMIVKTDNEWKAYSRNGKSIETIPHIIKTLKKIKIRNGYILDGELYDHGKSIQEISSAVKRKSKKSKGLKFVVFDMILNTDQLYVSRYETLNEKLSSDSNVIPIMKLLSGNVKRHFKAVNKNKNKTSTEDIEKLLDVAIKEGYEGLIARDMTAPYESGKRSRNMMKVKRFYDNEYKVLDVTEDKNGYGILHLEHDGKPFRCVAPGNEDDKWDVAENPKNYISEFVNIRYAAITPYGIPFHPVSTHFRNDL